VSAVIVFRILAYPPPGHRGRDDGNDSRNEDTAGRLSRWAHRRALIERLPFQVAAAGKYGIVARTDAACAGSEKNALVSARRCNCRV
jgi:hypothetical protein